LRNERKRNEALTVILYLYRCSLSMNRKSEISQTPLSFLSFFLSFISRVHVRTHSLESEDAYRHLTQKSFIGTVRPSAAAACSLMPGELGGEPDPTPSATATAATAELDSKGALGGVSAAVVAVGGEKTVGGAEAVAESGPSL
jgi:hypothetical protein